MARPSNHTRAQVQHQNQASMFDTTANSTQYVPKLATMVTNIRTVWSWAHPLERSHHREFYTQWNQLHAKWSKDTGVPIAVCAAVTAALSPNNHWRNNLRAAQHMIYNHAEMLDQCPEPIRRLSSMGTYHNRVDLANRILDTKDPGLLVGPKVTAFRDNILYPLRPLPLTIDGHAVNIAMGVKCPLDETVRLTPRVRARVHGAYCIAAWEITHAEGVIITPVELQAVTWAVWRRVKKV